MARYTRELPDKIELPASLQQSRRTVLSGEHELVRTSHENARHWRGADRLSGRASYPQLTRQIARDRSRYAAANNSWYAGMLRTAANHIVGNGPRLQILTKDSEVNARIESAYRRWCEQIRFATKLRVAIEAYWRDGEVFGLRGQSQRSSIGLNIRLFEGDQVKQPVAMSIDSSVEDGVRVDNFGDMVEAYIYDHHPNDIGVPGVNYLTGKWYPANRVWHLFRADRPGQLRGFPRCAPALDWLEHMRRYSKATLSAAELQALMPVFAQMSSSLVDEAVGMPSDFPTVDYDRGVVNFSPEGWEWKFMDPKYPGTTNEQFQRTELMYFCRCANMPYSLACGTSKDANFSAAKMDIVNLWWPEVLSERDAITNIVVIPTFYWFLEDCVTEAGVLDGAPPIDQINFRFDWPPLPVADEIDAANASRIRTESGQTTPRQESMARGEDYDSKIRTAADDYGVSVEEYKKAKFARDFAVKGILGGDNPKPETPPTNQVDYTADSLPQKEGAAT